MFKHSSGTLVAMAAGWLLLAGCRREPNLPPVKGAEEQSAAKAAFVQILEALDSGNQDKVWDGLSARSQARIKEMLAGKTKQNQSEKAKAVEVLGGIVGPKAKINGTRGTRSGVEVEFEYVHGKARDLEMVSEDGAWKLNLFSS